MSSRRTATAALAVGFILACAGSAGAQQDHATPQEVVQRVQQAAFKALVNSRTVRAAPVLAASLPKLGPKVLDQALDELMFLRHAKTVLSLEQFVRDGSGSLAASAATSP